MGQFPEVLDEIQISSNSSGIEQQQQQQLQQRQSNPTIISKFRNNFLPNTKQLTSRGTLIFVFYFFYICLFFQGKLPSVSTISKPVFAQPSQESTTGNQILLSTDEITIPRVPSSSVISTRPRTTNFIQDDAHV